MPGAQGTMTWFPGGPVMHVFNLSSGHFAAKEHHVCCKHVLLREAEDACPCSSTCKAPGHNKVYHVRPRPRFSMIVRSSWAIAMIQNLEVRLFSDVCFWCLSSKTRRRLIVSENPPLPLAALGCMASRQYRGRSQALGRYMRAPRVQATPEFSRCQCYRI